MPWWNPVTWFNGALVSAQQLNEQVRDNLRHLKGLDGPAHIENAIDLTVIAPPDAPAAGRQRLYASTDGLAWTRGATGPARPAAHLSARVTRTTNFSVANSATIVIPFTMQVHDDGGFHSTTLNPERFTISTAGVYLIGANVRFAANATGLRALSIRSIPGGFVANQTLSAGSFDIDLVVSAAVMLSAGSFVQCEVFQTSGGALNIIAFTAFSPTFWIVGPL